MPDTTALDAAVREAQTILAQCIIAANEAAEAAAYVKDVSPAPINSPHFTGVPTAPTADPETNSTQIATTAYLDSQRGAANGIATLDNTGHIPTALLPPDLLGGLSYQGTWDATNDVPPLSGTGGPHTTGNFWVVCVAGTLTLGGVSDWDVGDWAIYNEYGFQKVPANAVIATDVPISALQYITPGLIGQLGIGAGPPTVVTVEFLLTKLAAFVGDSGGGGVKGLVPAPAAGDAAAGKYLKSSGLWETPPNPNLSGYALLNSPAFSGTPTAPNAARDTNSTVLATAAFVLAQLAVIGEESSLQPDGVAAVGSSTHGARLDHVHPTDTSRAPLASPAFTGVPTAPTPSYGDVSTKIATTDYAHNVAVDAAADAAALVGPPVAGDGIAVSDKTVSINTNNALGVGCYGFGTVVGETIPPNGTTTAFYSVAPQNGTVGPGQSYQAPGTWRNISGCTITNSYCGMFIRIA